MGGGVVWGVILVAGWIALAPPVREAWWRIELLRAEPPRALPVPVDGVEPGDLADSWGASRPGGRRHEGIDIFARRRTPIRATTRGIVARRGPNPLGGRTVTILGPGGWRHYYAHLQSYAGESKGDRVEAGQVVGYVGTSGDAPPNAPHLHYGIYTRDGPIDPYPLLTARTDPAPRRSSPGPPAAGRSGR